MEPILVDDRFDPGEFGDLMDQRLRIVAREPMTTAATDRRLAVEGVADLLRRHQGAPSLAMSGLATAFLPTGRSGRPPLHPDGIGRGRLGRVGGVEFEPAFEIAEPVFKECDPFLVGSDKGKHRHLQLR
jgi:hypothetical protein